MGALPSTASEPFRAGRLGKSNGRHHHHADEAERFPRDGERPAQRGSTPTTKHRLVFLLSSSPREQDETRNAISHGALLAAHATIPISAAIWTADPRRAVSRPPAGRGAEIFVRWGVTVIHSPHPPTMADGGRGRGGDHKHGQKVVMFYNSAKPERRCAHSPGPRYKVRTVLRTPNEHRRLRRGRGGPTSCSGGEPLSAPSGDQADVRGAYFPPVARPSRSRRDARLPPGCAFIFPPGPSSGLPCWPGNNLSRE